MAAEHPDQSGHLPQDLGLSQESLPKVLDLPLLPVKRDPLAIADDIARDIREINAGYTAMAALFFRKLG